MKHPLQITVRNMSLSDAAKTAIQDKAAKLEAVDAQIIGCRVLVELPHKHQHQGERYNVRIDLTIPGAELVIKREGNEDLYVAIRDAFNAAKRRLRDRRRQQQIDAVVPREEAQPHARVSRLFPIEGYGFLETPDGRDVYFHRNSVLHDAFDHLEVGETVRYVETEGEKGPQASTVVCAPRHNSTASRSKRAAKRQTEGSTP
ncbi:MAG TPA: HPF/RaiA family ribosome-associated protein [Nitrospiria bacterium]|nr:HPF/RaiA family ribosome-associated protein [Nitrospiria bacterium]